MPAYPLITESRSSASSWPRKKSHTIRSLLTQRQVPGFSNRRATGLELPHQSLLHRPDSSVPPDGTGGVHLHLPDRIVHFTRSPAVFHLKPRR